MAALRAYAGSAPARQAVRRRPALLRREHLVILGAGFLGYAMLAWLAAYPIGTFNRDGIARMAEAHAVFFSREPHLAAIGFVWPPIPVLSNLPLVLVLKPLGAVLLAGGLMSAAYGAFALTQAAVALDHFGLPRGWRIVWVIAFAAHPLIVQNAAMGLSEAPLLAFLLLSLNGFLRWERSHRPGGLIWAGVGAAGAVYCRYEALAWVAALSAAIAWQLWLRARGVPVVADALPAEPAGGKSSGRAAAEPTTDFPVGGATVVGSVIAVVAPAAWALSLWVVLNWQIMGDPLYFLTGPGSTATTPDTASKVGPSHPYFYASGSPAGSARLLLTTAADLSPLLLLATAALAGTTLWRRRWGDLALLALGWSILGFTYLIAVRGLLPYFSRYFTWVVPAGFLLAAVAYRASGGAGRGRVRQALAALLAAVALGTSLGLPARALPRVPEPLPLALPAAVLLPAEVSDAKVYRKQLDEFVAIASYLDRLPPGTTTVLDATLGEALALYVRRPRDLIMTTDTVFKEVLRAPQGQVDLILVPVPTFDARGRSEVLKLYPALYNGGEPWAEYVADFPGLIGWRLYRVRHLRGET